MEKDARGGKTVRHRPIVSLTDSHSQWYNLIPRIRGYIRRTMKTLAILSQKGGSGKTTTAVHLAVCAAQQQNKVALIDTDPQASAWQWNGSRDETRKLDAVKA